MACGLSKIVVMDDEIITDSLWLLGKRDNSGVHTPEYWGNFVPQIPRQAMLRFTKPGDLVIDPFAGLGTTLYEAVRLGRHVLGVDLQQYCVDEVRSRLAVLENPHSVFAEILLGDSADELTCELVREWMRVRGFDYARLLILHPPYHDIIKFSSDPRDLSNLRDEGAFLDAFERVVINFSSFLVSGSFLVLVIGDKYSRGEWVPLGFRCMERVCRIGYRLKSICVKDIQENRGKRGQYALWRYRALKHNFYIFKHEYVMFFERLGNRE